jgi:hypothetical protein
MARYMIPHSAFIDGRLYPTDGRHAAIIELGDDVEPGSGFDPLDKAAQAALKRLGQKNLAILTEETRSKMVSPDERKKWTSEKQLDLLNALERKKLLLDKPIVGAPEVASGNVPDTMAGLQGGKRASDQSPV